jgi:diguanylate cyclase (GGDEF)-like protein
MGRTIASCLRESDVVSRYAIDAFAVLLPHTDLRDAPIVAQKIVDRFRARPHVSKGKSVQALPCIGMSQFPDAEVESAKEFITAAESALLQAEQKGPGSVVEGSRI